MAKRASNEPWVLERRAFLQLGAAGLTSLLVGWPNPAKAETLSRLATGVRAVTPRNSARNCILVMLRGGPSHVDMFDLKKGRWTPNELGVERLSNGIDWPTGILPRLKNQLNKCSIIRSLQHSEVVHERAEYFVETGRRLNPGLRNEVPHLGAVISLESEAQRTAQDVFPSFMLFNYGFSYSNNGFLSATHAPFNVFYPAYGIPNLDPPDGPESFNRRRAALQFVDGIGNRPTGTASESVSIFQAQAEKMMKDSATKAAFTATASDIERYGDNYFGSSLAVARNVLAANRGTRYIEVDHYGWDHHNLIYSNDNLYGRSLELDMAVSSLLEDLAATPGSASGKTLLDETLVMVMGEFGRTVGDLNPSSGRDHYPYVFSGLFAGGGVKGGRIIGATDDQGGGVQDFGWSVNRPIHMPDLVTTMFSVLGIDWTKTIADTPSGRIYRYSDPEAVGDDASYEISPLF